MEIKHRRDLRRQRLPIPDARFIGQVLIVLALLPICCKAYPEAAEWLGLPAGKQSSGLAGPCY
jgi:hypothetical protein